jgi:DNA-binding response OmpR family regulator
MTERILIAEDDPAIADSVGYSLRACGYHVDVAGSGEAVLESGPGSYDLLILDVMLPGLSRGGGVPAGAGAQRGSGADADRAGR